jgi:HK97 family phage major capsid protein
VIDRARNASRIIQAGAMTLPMEASEVHLPRLDTGLSGVWRAEGVQITPEIPAFGRITLKARTCAALALISQELLDDLSPQGLALIQNEMIQAIALKLDYAALSGAGAESEPLGIANTPGGATQQLADDGAVPVDWDWALGAIGGVEGANGDPTAVIYSARTATSLRKMKTGLSGDKTPLLMPERVAQLRHLVSNQIADDLTWGSSDATSEAYVGDFSNVIIGSRLGLRVRILNEVYADTLQIGLQVFFRADVAIAHPEHLCIVHGFKES